jgi:plasmid stabilization system protein ParE
VTLTLPHTGLSIHLAGVMVPLAVYFFVLGLLNTRRHPQLLTARQDLLLMVLALSPLGLVPLVSAAGLGWAALIALVAAAGIAGLHRLVPERGSWVIYNIAPAQARRAIRRALQACDVPAEPGRQDFRDEEGRPLLRISEFPILHNVSLRLETDRADLSARLPDALHRQLVATPSEPRQAGLAMLLVSTAMIVVPLTFAAPRAGEIVRLLGDLLN